MFLTVKPTRPGTVIDVAPDGTLVIEIPAHTVSTVLFLQTGETLSEAGELKDLRSCKGVFIGGKGGITIT